jgi:hypothetical protein
MLFKELTLSKEELLLILDGRKQLDLRDIVEYCESHELTLVEFCDSVSFKIAQEYLQNILDYSYCDVVMNGVFHLMIEDVFLKSNNNSFSEFAYDVFLAFDAGEYRHSKDDKSIDPSEKYTRPRVIQVLKKLESTNN